MKRIMIAIFTLILAVSLTSCGSDSLGDYKKAAEKTEQIEKGQTAGEFSVIMDFNTEGMTEKQIKELNYFKNMKGSFSAVFDKDENGEKGIIRNYLNFGGLGFDFDLFVNGEEIFMKLPIIGKYMKIDEMQAPMMQQEQDGDIEIISQETLDGINRKWLEMLKEEDIFRGKNIVLTTPDGEVKTTEYTIKLNDEQIKSLAVYGMDMLSNDKKLKESYEKYVKKNVDQLKDTSIEKLISNLKESIKEYTVENFSYTAYVDIDGYIVNEMIQVSLSVDKNKSSVVKGFEYKLDIKNWDINKDQEIDFPVLTEENTLDMDEMDQNMPFVIEDMLNNMD